MREELRFHNVSPETFVWREGLEEWVKAGTLPELSDIVASGSSQVYPSFSQPVPPPAQQPPHPSYQQPMSQGPAYYEEPVVHTNWLPWAIVATVLGFCTSCIGAVLGIIGIVYANKANNLYSYGNRQHGDSANKTARICTIIGLVLAGIGIVSSIVLFSTGMTANLSEMLQNLD